MTTFEKEQVKRANPIEQVIAELLHEQPQQIVGEELKFRCPWHDDNVPSLDVNPTKNGGVYCCRSCSDEHGDVITFVMKFNNQTFREALEWLAHRGNVIPDL